MSDELVCEECGKTWPAEKRVQYHNHRYRTHCLDTESYIERYKRIKTEIPERYRDAYENITGAGCAPKTVQAAVCYIESFATLEDAAEAFDRTPVSIRQMVYRLIDEDAVTLEYVRSNHGDARWQMFGEDRVNGEPAPKKSEA